MTIPGEVRVVRHVPQAFAQLVAQASPRSIALSGGGTARTCYELLATAADVEWRRVEVFFSDDRFVPVHDPDSNEGMAREAFLDEVEPAAIHSMYGAGPSIDRAAAAYDDLVRDAPALDLAHLGLGPDGHTASLFPGFPHVHADGVCVAVHGSPKPPPDRVTLTLAKLNASRRILLAVAGADKAPMLARVIAGPDPEVPASLLDRGRLEIIADAAALGG